MASTLKRRHQLTSKPIVLLESTNLTRLPVASFLSSGVMPRPVSRLSASSAAVNVGCAGVASARVTARASPSPQLLLVYVSSLV